MVSIIRALFALLAISTPSLALDILYPFYAVPGQSWIDMASLIKLNSKVTFTVVVNVNNGPGIRPNALYAAGIQILSVLPNVKVLGYIDTRYGNCFNWAKASAACAGSKGPTRVSDVYTQMGNWVKFYGAKNIKGFYFDNFLPYGGQAVKSAAAISSVLQDYSTIFKYSKKTYPSFTIVGNAVLLDPSFKSSTLKLADVLAVQQAARNILSNPSDKTQVSLAFVPSGYQKALITNKIVLPLADAKAQIAALAGLAKKWKVTHFVAVRDFAVYPSDLMPYLIAVAK